MAEFKHAEGRTIQYRSPCFNDFGYRIIGKYRYFLYIVYRYTSLLTIIQILHLEFSKPLFLLWFSKMVPWLKWIIQQVVCFSSFVIQMHLCCNAFSVITLNGKNSDALSIILWQIIAVILKLHEISLTRESQWTIFVVFSGHHPPVCLWPLCLHEQSDNKSVSFLSSISYLFCLLNPRLHT